MDIRLDMIRIAGLVFIMVSAAALAAAYLPLKFWGESATAVLTVLAVIGAAVLFRLSRGIPVSTPEYFEVDEIKSLTAAMKKIARALQALTIVIIIAMAILVFAQPIHKIVEAGLLYIKITEHSDSIVSGFIAFLLSYIFIRIVHIVQSDVDLVDLQSEYMISSAQRKRAHDFEQTLSQSETPPFKNPPGYGKRLQ